MLALGNVAPIERILTNAETGQHETRVIDGPRVTHFGTPADWPLMEKLTALVGANGSWNWHSSLPPAWVESGDDPILAQAVAEHFHCTLGRPDDWDQPETEGDDE